MIQNKTIKEIVALREAAIEDLLAMSDAELRAEAQEDGENLDAIVSETRNALRDAAAAALRLRMNKTKSYFSHALSQQRLPAKRPSLDQIKRLVLQLFDNEPAVGLAFREGKRQSESDWQSLYDDLVSMGAIKDGPDEH